MTPPSPAPTTRARAAGRTLRALRSRNPWTLATVAVLLLSAVVGTGYALAGRGQVVVVSTIAVVVSLVLAGLAWRETRWSVRLVVVGGLVTTALFVAITVLVGPAVGSTSTEVWYDLCYRRVPVTATPSYRRLVAESR